MRSNNFDLLRILLALLVVRCHGALVGWEWPWTSDRYFLGGRSAVECFFVISGYLIFRSWEAKPNLTNYVEKRARRILPAYVFVVMACALGLCALSSLPWREYFRSPELYAYVGSHLVFLGFLQNTLPGVFSDHVQDFVNGPLWTNKIEVMFYACVPVIALLAKRFNRPLFVAAIYVLAILWVEACIALAIRNSSSGLAMLSKQLPGQMSFFIAGGALHYYSDIFHKYAKPMFAISSLVLAAYFTLYPQIKLLQFIYPAALAVFVIFLAVEAPYLGNAGKYGDFSYGIYIYHYPILQIMAEINGLDRPVSSFAIAFAATLVLSFFSWHWLERPFLHRTSHYVQASDTPTSRASFSKTESASSQVQ